ncbi:MAG: hypothetical protein WKG03_18695, partial [Telluria sp.]
MSFTESPLFPLVGIDPVANMQNAWVALNLRVEAGDGDLHGALRSLFSGSDLLSAIAPLNCILMLASPAVLDLALLALLPAARVWYAFDAGALHDEQHRQHMLELHERGHRILIDGALPEGVSAPAGICAVATDFSNREPAGQVLPLVYGPHLAHGVNSAA